MTRAEKLWAELGRITGEGDKFKIPACHAIEMAFRAEIAKRPGEKELQRLQEQNGRLVTYLRRIAHDSKQMVEAHEMFASSE